MPCYEPPEARVEYKEGVDPFPYEQKINELSKRANALEAALCATFNELERRGIAIDVAAKSSRSGLIDLVPWYKAHKKEDETRLGAEIHKYSIDEQKVIFKLLKQQLDE